MYAEWFKSKGQELPLRTKIILEVGIPSFSICALLGVTAYITSDAVEVIKSHGVEDDVNVDFLYGFASANFVVDIISTFLFYVRRKDVFLLSKSGSSKNLSENDAEINIGGEVVDPGGDMGPSEKNLNMISAFTHVGGDTMRTCAVFIAAVVSDATSTSGSLCDAWAAIVVSISIVFCVMPLGKEIYHKAVFITQER
jgi:Co/Zn/Cd efflux system component